MTRFRLLTSASLAAIALAAPLHADVTAEDIWQDWQSYMQSFGYTMTGTEARSGDTLTVTGVEMALEMNEADDGVDGVVAVRMPQMVFTELGDGSVRVGLPERSEIVFESAPGAAEAVNVVGYYDQTGFDMLAKGDPAAVSYTYSAEQIALSLGKFTVDGETLPPEAFSVAISIAGVTGTTDLRTGDLRSYDQTMTTGAVTASMTFKDPEGSESGDIAYKANSLSYTGTAAVPSSGAVDLGGDLTGALRAGFMIDGTFSTAGAATDIAFDGADGAGTINLASGTNTLGILMSESAGIGYEIAQTDMTLNMLVPDVPLPIQAAMQGLKLDLVLPVLAGDAPQDFKLVTEMNGVTISDLIWGLFDAGGALPRDPATVQVGLTGQAKVLFDWMDPAQQQALASSGALPAELQSLNLTNLVVDLAGAALTGTGAFTVTPGINPIFGPLGTPAGQVDLRLEGGNGLMDKLVQMGLLPEDQAMGARMMLGLFARPVEGQPDTLTSTIEINEQGHILANGQRIQ
ncbi:MAG: DUF2125 domain-containing protein [Pseudomonadota bacterium]